MEYIWLDGARELDTRTTKVDGKFSETCFFLRDLMIMN